MILLQHSSYIKKATFVACSAPGIFSSHDVLPGSSTAQREQHFNNASEANSTKEGAARGGYRREIKFDCKVRCTKRNGPGYED